MSEAGVARIIRKAEDFCREAGLRLTAKRKNVLAVLAASELPLSAYDVADHYRERFSDGIPVMSVYRMLDFLIEENLVHKLESSNKYLACSHIVCDHAHETPQFLICDHCQRVTEIAISNDTIEALRDSVAAVDFHLRGPKLELHGLCGQCRAAES
ncbi:MAG: transcriptional repressor [Porticoccaceae bacterium]